MCIVSKDEDFIVAQDNARYARRSIGNSYDTAVAFYSEDLRKKSLERASIIAMIGGIIDRKPVSMNNHLLSTHLKFAYVT